MDYSRLLSALYLSKSGAYDDTSSRTTDTPVISSFFGSAFGLEYFINNTEKYGVPVLNSKNSAQKYADAQIKKSADGSLLFENIDMTRAYPGFTRSESMCNAFPYGINNGGLYYLNLEQTSKQQFISLSKDTLVDIIPVFIREQTNIGADVAIKDSIRERLEWSNKTKILKELKLFLGTQDDVIITNILYERIIFVLFMTFYHIHSTLFYNILKKIPFETEISRTVLHITSRYHDSCGINILKTLGLPLLDKNTKKTSQNEKTRRESKYDSIDYVTEQIRYIYKAGNNESQNIQKIFTDNVEYSGRIPYFKRWVVINDDHQVDINSNCTGDDSHVRILKGCTNKNKDDLKLKETRLGSTSDKILYVPGFDDFLDKTLWCELNMSIYNFIAKGLLEAYIQIVARVYNILNTDLSFIAENTLLHGYILDSMRLVGSGFHDFNSYYDYLGVFYNIVKNESENNNLILTMFFNDNLTLEEKYTIFNEIFKFIIDRYRGRSKQSELVAIIKSKSIGKIKSLCENASLMNKSIFVFYLNVLQYIDPESRFFTESPIMKKCPFARANADTNSESIENTKSNSNTNVKSVGGSRDKDKDKLLLKIQKKIDKIMKYMH